MYLMYYTDEDGKRVYTLKVRCRLHFRFGGRRFGGGPTNGSPFCACLPFSSCGLLPDAHVRSSFPGVRPLPRRPIARRLIPRPAARARASPPPRRRAESDAGRAGDAERAPGALLARRQVLQGARHLQEEVRPPSDAAAGVPVLSRGARARPSAAEAPDDDLRRDRTVSTRSRSAAAAPRSSLLSLSWAVVKLTHCIIHATSAALPHAARRPPPVIVARERRRSASASATNKERGTWRSPARSAC